MFFNLPVQNSYADQVFYDENGDVYFVDQNGELAGIGSFFKKLAAVALPIAGTIAAPFTGGMSVAASTALSSAMNAGGGLVGGLLSGGGGAGGVAKGLAGITAFGNEVMSALEKVKSGVAQNPSEAAAAADGIAALLGDGTKVFQAQKGKDAAALADFKTKAAAKVQEIKGLAAQVVRQTQAAQTSGGQSPQAQMVQLPNGQVVMMQPPSESGGFDTTTILLFAAVGLGAIFLLKK